MLNRSAHTLRTGSALRKVMDDLIMLMALVVGFGLISAPTASAQEPECDIEAFCASVPTELVNVDIERGGDVSYWSVDVFNAGEFNMDDCEAWCLDSTMFIPQRQALADLLCSYDPMVDVLGIVQQPENMDLVNYILNQDYLGLNGPAGPYTYSEIQKAIWILVSIDSNSGLGPWTQANVDAIVNDAQANGEGFVPGAGDVIGVIILPYTDGGELQQPMICPYPLPCDPPPPPPPDVACETAFGLLDGDETCFLDLGFDRWGWTNGPLGPGVYELDMWAGAGQCDTSKGALVGQVTIDYDGSTVEVTYEVFEGCALTETHLYVGDTPVPLVQRGRGGLQGTVAPGQYGNTHEFEEGVTEDSFTVDASGDIFVIAHAVVCCGDEE